MSRKKILVVIDEMEVGGSQRQIVHLLTGLDRSRWHPELAFFRSDSFMADAIRRSGIDVHHLPKRGRFDLRFWLAFARLLRRGDYDLIHAFSLTAELWTVLARYLCWRRPLLVASVRNQYLDKPPWYWRIKRFVLRRSIAAITNSLAGAKTTAAQTGMRPGWFDMVANGVAEPVRMTAAERDGLRTELGIPAGRVMGLFVGRLVEQKNLGCLVRALALLPDGQRPRMLLVGTGPLREWIAAQAAEAGVSDAIAFLGVRSDVGRLMQAADFLVLPSHYEGMSNVLLEAMIAGCPVVASAVSGSVEAVEHDRTGLLFPPDDASSFAECLARLISGPELRAELSRQALDYVRREHGVPHLVAATVKIYERCLASEAAGAEPFASAAASSTGGRGHGR